MGEVMLAFPNPLDARLGNLVILDNSESAPIDGLVGEWQARYLVGYVRARHEFEVDVVLCEPWKVDPVSKVPTRPLGRGAATIEDTSWQAAKTLVWKEVPTCNGRVLLVRRSLEDVRLTLVVEEHESRAVGVTLQAASLKYLEEHEDT